MVCRMAEREAEEPYTKHIAYQTDISRIRIGDGCSVTETGHVMEHILGSSYRHNIGAGRAFGQALQKPGG